MNDKIKVDEVDVADVNVILDGDGSDEPLGVMDSGLKAISAMAAELNPTLGTMAALAEALNAESPKEIFMNRHERRKAAAISRRMKQR